MNPQLTSASGPSPKDQEEQLMEPTEDYHGQPDTEYHASPIPDPNPEPSSKAKDKSKKSKRKSRHSWLDNDDTPQGDWLTNLIQAQPALPVEEPLPGNTLQFTQSIMADLHIKKLTKTELRRINKDAQVFLKKRSGNQMEYEFHMQNIASAMSAQFDWLNPEVYFDAQNPIKPFVTDWTKPLPLLGFPEKPKIPYTRFFNKDLNNLQLSDDNSKQMLYMGFNTGLNVVDSATLTD